MDKAKIFLEDGNEKNVNSIFYLYNSKYYFLYTLNELDENGYVRLYLAKVGKETTNTEAGPVETGNMIGIEVPTDEEWKEIQTSISKIVNSKKTKVEDKEIKYLPIDMLTNLKIVGKKTFRLLSGIIENDFGVNISEDLNVQVENNNLNGISMDKPIEVDTPNIETSVSTSEEITNVFGNSGNSDSLTSENQESPKTQSENMEQLPTEIQEENNEIADNSQDNNTSSEQSDENKEYEESDIIIDYRTRFFEEQEKNKHLKEEIESLEERLSNIEKIIKGE